MATLLICLAVVLLVAVALYSSMKGEASTVSEADLGGINTFDAYYGKDAHRYGGGGPCQKCMFKGCIGVGQCRCSCHRKSEE